jgi:hypothetical protein
MGQFSVVICRSRDFDHISYYIDDILIRAEEWYDNITTLEVILELLVQGNMTVRPTKCMIGTDVDFWGLGTKIPLADRVEKVRRKQRPLTKKAKQSSLGPEGFYREHIPNYSAVATPLRETDNPKRLSGEKIRKEHMYP